MRRANDMVELSGLAVSLGEIEQTLLRHEAVRRAAVLQHEGRLIAFVESEGVGHLSLEEWRDYLAETLPGRTLPAQVTTVDRMPVDSCGKLDRQALLGLAAAVISGRGEAPRDAVERQIAEVWEESLGVRPIMRDANFFALGGTSLSSIEISQRLQSLGHAVTAQSVLVAGTVASLAGKIARAVGPDMAALASGSREHAATTGQEDFWIASKLGLATNGSQVTRVLAARGRALTAEEWQSAWSRVVARHAALRTAFFADDRDKVFCRTLEVEELGTALEISRDRCNSLNDARERIAALCDAPYPLTQAPLGRAGLVEVADGNDTLFWFALHHAVIDGLSVRIVQEEMHAILLGRALPEVPNGVALASRAEACYLASDRAVSDGAWWRQKLDTLARDGSGEAFQEFATDYRRPANASGKPAAPVVERLDAAAVTALNRLAQAHCVGLHALLLALLGVEARRRSGRRDLIIGSGISVRPAGADRAVGYFVNLLPLVLTGGAAPTLAEDIRGAQRAVTEAVERANYPSGLAYREFRQRHPHARPHARTSLFDISLTGNPSRTSGEVSDAFLLAPRRLPGELTHPEAGLDLAFTYEPLEDGGLELALVWDPDVYNRKTAQAWLGGFAGWARWLAADLARVDAPLPPLLPWEAECLGKWEYGPERARPAKRFHEIFEHVADACPNAPAVVAESGVQSYAEVEQQANRIARALRDTGVLREQPVAVLTECSADLPATVLGIWKAGAAYLPLALEQPPERQLHMLEDSGAEILIVLDGHPVPAPVARAVKKILHPADWNGTRDAERLNVPGTPQDLAFIVYTSGTTGMPKGVMLQHDGLVNAVYASQEVFGLTPEDRFSLVATPGFDASLWEMGTALAHGLALVPVSRALRDDPWALKKWYKTYGVTVAFHTPSYLRVSKNTPFEGLRVLICGGEAPTHDDVDCHANHVAFWNGCGPTETTIFVCAELIPPHPDPNLPLTLGRPLPNTRLSFRRESGEPVPPGVVGELWINGTGVARSYLNSPELTARRFVETPEGRFYRSGDLGRWTEDGRLELTGRIDHQIKLHGQRVELGEIEQAVASHPAVEEAVALMDAAARDTKVLLAYVRLREDAAMPALEEWRDYLGGRLPAHMIPASVIPVASMPLMFSGKLDRDALLRTPRGRSDAAKSPPRGDLETRVARIWADLLGTPVAREDNFFGLGGNSLLAVTLAHQLSREFGRALPARELFAAPTLAAFAHRIAALVRTELAATGTPAANAPRSDAATEGQREFRVAEAAGLDTGAFTIPMLRTVEGEMPPLAHWNRAWAALVARHESMRTYFVEDAAGTLRRAVVPALASRLETSTQPDQAAAWAFVRSRQAEPFYMCALPLWRAGLVEVTGSGEHLFWLALHHSLGDGRSLGIIVEELGALLRGETLPPLTGDFGQSAAREETYLAGPAHAADARYWGGLLGRLPDSALEEGPLDFARSITTETGTHRFEMRLDPSARQGLNALARQQEASLHAVLLTLLALEARRRTGREDMVLGTTADTRETAEEGQVVGYYVNMLPLPCHLPRGVSFGDAVREMQRTLAEGLQHAHYPFAAMYRDFWSRRPQQRQPARYPLFDMAVTENPAGRPVDAALRLTRGAAPAYERTFASPGQDMVLVHEALPDGRLLLQWQVNAALYKRETASLWFQALSGWARWLAENPERARGPLPAFLPSEAELLEGWEQGAKAARPSLRFHEVFEGVADMPDQANRAAVVTETGVITYAALEREANAIAHGLLARGAARGTVVGVLTGRSANLPAAVLGIWKAGAAYLPLAADLPPERTQFMARDAGAAILMVLDGLAVPPVLPAVFRPEEMDAEFRRAHSHRPRTTGSAGDDAYVIYTSGSTGRPKGTLIGHDAYLNSVLGVGESIGLTRDDRSLMFSSPSFDVSLSDMGMPLAFGAALCPVPYEVLSSPIRFRAFLTDLNVTVADVTPTYLRLFDGARLPSLRALVTGGEAPFAADVAIYADRLAYFNAYGPTENTISSTIGRLTAGCVPGGRPLPNTSVHVCDSAGNPVPPGVVGELWLGGAGLARGYVGRDELTAAAFVETPRGRRYRTGDLGRWSETGNIEILGRLDDQVKLNGIRVELGEIEHTLACHPDIAQAVALVDSGAEGSHGLWAFVRPLPGRDAPPEGDWREYLAARLPAYMIPAAVMAVANIPLTNSGKVDKAALKGLLVRGSTQCEGSLPEDGLEAEIAGLWSDLLGQRRGAIGREDNFFALGGHSLLAIAASHRLETTLGYPVSARELFAEPTLRGFASRVRQLGGEEVPVRIVSDRATEGQREFWVAEQAGFDTRAFNISLTLEACGNLPADTEWGTAWAALVQRHDALRTGFREDKEGVLRRYALPVAGCADMELSSHADLPGALTAIAELQTAPFTMGDPPLWRAGLARVTDTEQRLFWLALHHSVGDGVSLGVLTEELSALLEGRAEGRALPPMDGHYDDSAGVEESYLAGPARREDEFYWRNLLGAQSRDEWPLDFPRPLGRGARSARGAHGFGIRLDAATAGGLRDLAQRNGASLHALMLAIMAQEVRRRTGREEFLLGTAASTRESAREARTVGYYVNPLPLACRVRRGDSVEQALGNMQRNLAQGLQHARYPFALMYRDGRRDYVHPARYPLFDMAVTENPGVAKREGGFHLRNVASLTGYELRMNAPAQDMVLVHEAQADGSLRLQWYVNAAIYAKETAAVWFESLAGWARLLADGKRRPGTPLPALLP
jgi:amino acid adenylation domain-containing protein